MASPKRISDGSVDFSGGIDSGRVSTIYSQSNPNGLKRNQLAWMTNCSVRGGGITQRVGWNKIGTILPQAGLYQCGNVYITDSGFPHLILSVDGQIFKVAVSDPGETTGFSVTNLSATFGLSNPATVDQAFMCQGERFLVIQAGDYTTLPLFYDGLTMRRSNGPTGSPKEIPAAGPMDYYMGRLWYAGVPNKRTYCAGDIVQGPSGTLAYQFRDAILRITENPVAVGGDGFTVPDTAGDIRAIHHSANIDTTLGEGQLFVFTRKQVYSLSVPVSRADWIAADSTNAPVQKVVQIHYGTSAERSIVPANGDLFYQSLEPAIRSLMIARRDFQQWGNRPISRNMNRLLQFNDRGLMYKASGVQFSNRMLQLESPVECAAGIGYKTVAVLDFDVISSLEEKLPPAWEGMYEGLTFLQLLEGDWGGLNRAFAVVLSEAGTIDLWELTDYLRTDVNDYGESRVTWSFETPAYSWGNEFQLKELEGMDIWIDKVYGPVLFNVEYRPDGDPCWHPWFKWKFCSARNSCEDATNPVCYPVETYRESYKSTAQLPKPQMTQCATGMSRPAAVGFQFQFRFTIKGWCRVRGLLAHALERERAPLSEPVCVPQYGWTTEDSI